MSRRWALPAIAIMLWSLACSDTPAPNTPGPNNGEVPSNQTLQTPQAEQPEARWARRFLPFEPSWRPESEVPTAPQESPGMVIWEVSTFAADQPASAVHRKAAADFVERCFDAALRNGWLDFQKGLADGYKIMFGDRNHYANWEFIRDDRVLDPDRPEFLMYYGTPQGKKLSGFMFLSDTPEGPGPQVAGPLSIWHWHTWTLTGCLLEGLLTVGVADKAGRCERGEERHRSAEMLHVWLVDHRDGPFATSMSIEPTRFRDLEERRRKDRGAPW